MPNAAKRKRAPEEMPDLSPSAKPLPRRERDPAYTLKSLRAGSGKTQLDVSKTSGLAQPEVSRIETRESLDELQVSTLRRYIEALGGRLDLVATFPTGHRMRLAGAFKVT